MPKELDIDLFEGKPWVSVVAFTMEKIRPKNLPSFAPISNFDEINIRTYIRSNNKTGVYFLSIEGGTKLSCKIAKGISELPYRFSKMKRSPNKRRKYCIHVLSRLQRNSTLESILSRTQLIFFGQCFGAFQTRMMF